MLTFPRWILTGPDAIQQFQALDRDLLTRRDREQLFGVSRARAATLMREFGAELTGNLRTLARSELLRRLRARRMTVARTGEQARRERLVTARRQARMPGVRVPVPPGRAHLAAGGLAGWRHRRSWSD